MTRKNRQTKNAKDVQDRKRMSKNIKRLCELKTVLMEKTNADSTGLMDSTWMKISEIDEVLEGKGVHASRKSLYEDLKALSDLADLNIESCGKTRNRKNTLLKQNCTPPPRRRLTARGKTSLALYGVAPLKR